MKSQRRLFSLFFLTVFMAVTLFVVAEANRPNHPFELKTSFAITGKNPQNLKIALNEITNWKLWLSSKPGHLDSVARVSPAEKPLAYINQKPSPGALIRIQRGDPHSVLLFEITESIPGTHLCAKAMHDSTQKTFDHFQYFEWCVTLSQTQMQILLRGTTASWSARVLTSFYPRSIFRQFSQVDLYALKKLADAPALLQRLP